MLGIFSTLLLYVSNSHRGRCLGIPRICPRDYRYKEYCLFIHNDFRKLHVVSDIHLAVAIDIAYDNCLIIAFDDNLASRNVGVLIAGLCGVDGDFVGLGQGEL